MINFLNFRYILSIIGKIILVEAAFMLTCVFWSLVNDDNTLMPFVASVAIILFSSIVLHLFSIGARNKELNTREAYLTLVLSWVSTCGFGALPFVLTGATSSVTDAIFESISGFSTTGSTIFKDIEHLPQSILWWRGLTHWMGGMGILLLVVAILPFLRVAGLHIFATDSSGLGTEKLNPRINQTARRLWAIYLALTVAQSLLLMMGEMSVFDSIVHSFSTISTGGFGVRNDSFASYSAYTQYVTASFMLVSGINFVLIYYVLKLAISKLLSNQEFITYLLIAAASVAVITAGLFLKQEKGLEESFRLAFFQASSIISTTGFTIADYMLWPNVCWTILLFLMFMGASSGSPGGGVKVVRVIMEFKVFSKMVKRLYHPKAIITLSLNGKKLDDNVVLPIMAFILLYFTTFAVASAVLMSFDLDMSTSVGAVISALGSVGPGLGDTALANSYATMPYTAKITLSACMVLGRMELIPVYLLLSRGFWKN